MAHRLRVTVGALLAMVSRSTTGQIAAMWLPILTFFAQDNRHGTFFQLLTTPRPYAKFPFFNMMNIEDRFAILLLRPHPKVTVTSEFHALRLSNANDLWYTGGGAFQPWTFGYTGRSTSGSGPWGISTIPASTTA